MELGILINFGMPSLFIKNNKYELICGIALIRKFEINEKILIYIDARRPSLI
jgi:hypothetical protein